VSSLPRNILLMISGVIPHLLFTCRNSPESIQVLLLSIPPVRFLSSPFCWVSLLPPSVYPNTPQLSLLPNLFLTAFLPDGYNAILIRPSFLHDFPLDFPESGLHCSRLEKVFPLLCLPSHCGSDHLHFWSLLC